MQACCCSTGAGPYWNWPTPRAAELQGRARVPSGRLRISAPHGMDLTELPALINDFLGHYPEVSISLVLSNRQVDLTEEGVDIALRFGPSANENLIVRKLVPMELSVCAAPMYWRKHGIPAHPTELAHHLALVSTQLSPTAKWRFKADGQPLEVEVPREAGRNGSRPADPGGAARCGRGLSALGDAQAVRGERAAGARAARVRSQRHVAVGRLPAAPSTARSGAPCVALDFLASRLGPAGSRMRMASKRRPAGVPQRTKDRRHMVTLHHCVSARWFRPLWTLEEMGLSYELKMLPFPPRVLSRPYSR